MFNIDPTGYFMKKFTITILVIFCFITAIFICGCTEQNNNGSSGKKVTMTAKEYYNDQETIQGPDNTTINFKSLDEGDTLMIQDEIFKISYEIDFDKTIMLFVDEENLEEGVFFEFEGDLTGNYFINDQVRITVKIKKVIFSNQNISIELFEGQWVDEEYFNTNGYKPLPPSCITKI